MHTKRRDVPAGRLYQFVFLCVLCVFAVSLTGCQEKRKALVSAHGAVGELLVSTKDQARILYAQKVINERTYRSIRINWLRAQASYLTASDMLETIIDGDMADITAYTELITQVSTILSDIAVWLSEPHPTSTIVQGGENESTNDRIVSHPTPAHHREVGGGGAAGTGVERVRQGVIKGVNQGDEGKGSANDMGKLKVVSVSESVYNAHDAIQIHGVTDKTREVRVWVSVGAIVYTLDDSEPVLTDGAPRLAISECLTLGAGQARMFRAKAGVSRTKLHVMILEW